MHVVFARGADMEAFLGALRYVEVVEVQGEVAEGQQGQQQAAAGEAGGWLWAKEAASLWLEEEAGKWLSCMSVIACTLTCLGARSTAAARSTQHNTLALLFANPPAVFAAKFGVTLPQLIVCWLRTHRPTGRQRPRTARVVRRLVLLCAIPCAGGCGRCTWPVLPH